MLWNELRRARRKLHEQGKLFRFGRATDIRRRKTVYGNIQRQKDKTRLVCSIKILKYLVEHSNETFNVKKILFDCSIEI